MESAKRRLVQAVGLTFAFYLPFAPTLAQVDDAALIDPCSLVSSAEIASAFEDPDARWAPFVSRDGDSCTWSPQQTPEHGHVVIEFVVGDPPEFERENADAPTIDVEGVGDDAFFSVEGGQLELVASRGRANIRLTLDVIQNRSDRRAPEAAKALARIALDNVGSFPVAAPPDLGGATEDEDEDGFDSTGLITAIVAAAVSIACLSLLLWAFQRLFRRPARIYEGPPRVEVPPLESQPARTIPLVPAEVESEPRVIDLFPIPGYAEMTSKQILAVLPELSVASLVMVRARESLTEKRPEVLNAIAELMEEARKELAVPTLGD